MPEANNKLYYRAMLARDRRFDGKVYVGVHTTGIYCRPICPARKPLFKNITFYPNSAAAEEAGFRPCFRCRPESSPGTPAWQGTSASVSKALRLIASGIVEEEGMAGLTRRVGIGERHLRRLFVEHLGAPPQTIVRVRRLDFARRLLDDTSLSVADIAFASGFESLRRFNGAFKERFQKSPREVRKSKGQLPSGNALAVRIFYRPPYDWNSLLGFLSGRAIPGVELVENETYSRTFRLNKTAGWLQVRHLPSDKAIELSVHTKDSELLLELVERIKRVFDTDADPLAIFQQLGKDRGMRDLIRRSPGLRVPGAWEGFELAVRAILGQQVSVAGATTLVGRIVAKFGEPIAIPNQPKLRYLFPTAEKLMSADLSGLGITGARIATIRELARKVFEGDLTLNGLGCPEETTKTLLAIKGIGPWTVDYISLRALQNPDAFPISDLVIRRALQRAPHLNPESWRPWRAYATLHLWKGSTEPAKRRNTK